MDHASALVLAGDEGVAMALAVAARSTAEKLSPVAHPRLYVLDLGLSWESRAKMRRAVEQVRPDLLPQWLPVDEQRFVGLPLQWPGLTKTTYARLLIADLLPSSIRRVVYLDADVLVRRDLSPLLTMNLDGAAIGAVQDTVKPTPYFPTPYFNAGVMVIDLKRWRDESIGDRALARAASDPTVVRGDQDAINAIVPDWREIDISWNVQVGNLFGPHGRGLAESREHVHDDLVARRWQLYRDAAIVHFLGPHKPWQRPCPLPGTTAWVRAMLSASWLSPGEVAPWLARYAIARSRYAIGTTRLLAARYLRSRLA